MFGLQVIGKLYRDKLCIWAYRYGQPTVCIEILWFVSMG